MCRGRGSPENRLQPLIIGEKKRHRYAVSPPTETAGGSSASSEGPEGEFDRLPGREPQIFNVLHPPDTLILDLQLDCQDLGC
jgi:hypothetical protein